MRRHLVDISVLEGRTAGDRLVLPEETAHYLITVLRLDAGSPVELFDGDGLVVTGTLVDIEHPTIEIQQARRSRTNESRLTTHLMQAIPKGKRWDTVLEKSTELGVSTIVPLETERTIVKIGSSKVAGKVARWESMAASAARQSGRTVTPVISAPLPVAEGLARYPQARHLVAHTTGDDRLSLSDALLAGGWTRGEGDISAIAIWTGPEGGFTPGEITTLRREGAICFHLGPRILRSDTAGLVALSLVQALLGDLGADR